MEFVITINHNGELKTITRDQIAASIQQDNHRAEPGLRQLEFVLTRVLTQRLAAEEAASRAVGQVLLASPAPEGAA